MKKTFLSLAVILSGLVTQAATIAYYEFNGSGTASVGSTVADSAGGHNGTVVGGDLLYGNDPLVGSYLRFDADSLLGGASNRVVIAGSPDFVFSVNGTYTFEAIFRTTQTGTNGVLLSKGADVSNPDSQWWLRHRGDGRMQGLTEGDGGNGIEDGASSPTLANGGPQFNDGTWHHVAMVFDGAGTTKRFDLYVDYVLRGSDTAIGTLGMMGGTDSDPIIFGEFASGASARSYAGDLAAVRFSNTALGTVDFLPVPEPSSFALLGLGLFGCLFCRRSTRGC